MRLSPDVAALLRELDRASLDGYGTEFVVLSKDHTPYVRNKALESGWIEAQGSTTDRVYRITADGRKALAQNAEGWKNGEPTPARAHRTATIEWNETHRGESDMDIVIGTRIDPDKGATLPAVERLARSIATMQAIERIVLAFPTFPEPPMERRLVDQNLEMIHALLAWALEPALTNADLLAWDALLQAALAEYTAV